MYCLVWVPYAVRLTCLSVPASHETVPDGLRSLPMAAGQYLSAFRLIVRIDFFQSGVEYGGKFLYGIRHLGKFY